MENKSGFVQELGELLREYTGGRTGVQYLEYSKDPDGFEAVTICFDNGSDQTINVTGDSILAIINDVTRKLIRA